MFVVIDGPTDSKNTFKGVVGKLLPRIDEFDWNPRFRKVSDGHGLPDISDETAAADTVLGVPVYQVWKDQV